MTDKYRPLKNALGRFATGIAVAACRGEDGIITAITVNSFTSVSLEPALVLWCIENRASAYSVFMEADHYGVSILRASQRMLSDRYAGYLPNGAHPEDFNNTAKGAPLLKERLAGFDCKVVARHDAGDHAILVGEVRRFDCAKGAPLIYYASRYIQGTELS